MKQNMLIAAACAIAMLSGPSMAMESQPTGHDTSANQGWTSNIASKAPSEADAAQPVRLAKGSNQGCSTGTNSSGGRKCVSDTRSISFPTMIGVYR